MGWLAPALRLVVSRIFRSAPGDRQRVANHIGLEPCAVAREGGGEASVEEHTGQPLSLAKILIPGADAVANAEGNTCGRVKASVQTARRGRRTWHVWKLAAWEPGDPTS